MPDRHTALQPIPVEQLETLLDRRAEQQQRPRATPREVLAVWMGNAGAGVGAALLTGVGCSVAGVVLWPTGVQVAGAVGGVVFGAAMVWRALTDEATAQLSNRRVRRLVSQIEAEKAVQVAKLSRQLGAAFDAIEELERSLNRMTSERDSAILDKKRALEQAQSANMRNFVRASDTDSQVIVDAHEMLRYFFESGGAKWYSRAVANGFGWSDKRHRTAQQLLVDSGVVVINEKRPRVLESSLDVALRKFNDHIARVDSVYVPIAAATPDDEEDY